MGGTPEPVENDTDESLDEAVSAVAPLLSEPGVWIDPPPELGDEVVDSVRSHLN